MFGYRKNKELFDNIMRYLQEVSETSVCFTQAMHYYLANGINEEFENQVKNVHSLESSADNHRREIEITMYKKSLLPDSRADILELIERIDRLPNRNESILWQILTENVTLPDMLKDEFAHLVDLSEQTVSLVAECANDIFLKGERVKELTDHIDSNESTSDKIERTLIRRLFTSDMDLGEKLLVKDVILQTGKITDDAESIADRITIFNIKRQV